MKLTSLALILAMTAAIPAHAGGPVIVEETEVAPEQKRNGWIVPVIVGALILCAIACGGGDDAPEPTKPPPAGCKNSEGC